MKIFKRLIFLFVSALVSGCTTNQVAMNSHNNTKPLPELTEDPAKPIKVEQPCFPTKAVNNNAEGWVQVEFSLDKEGKPVKIVSLDDSPAGLFEFCALSSIKRWVFELPASYHQDARYQFVFEFKLG